MIALEAHLALDDGGTLGDATAVNGAFSGVSVAKFFISVTDTNTGNSYLFEADNATASPLDPPDVAFVATFENATLVANDII